MDNIPVDSIELETCTNDDDDDNYTLSSEKKSNKIVVITPPNREKGLYKPEETPVLREYPQTPNELKII